MNPYEFLQAELGHAERQLARVRRIQTKMQQELLDAGLDEVAVYEKLATHKAYRQLQRDENTFQQMWLRVHRHLQRLEQTKPGQRVIPFEQAVAAVNAVAKAAAPASPKPAPSRNAPLSLRLHL